MLEFLTSGAIYVLAFVLVLTVLVFVHEYGHYKIARINNIRVEVFSIGFGPEIWGRTDKNGTRWKISWVPLGGYVKFFGDLDAASGKDGKIVDNLSPEERAVCFHHKTVWQRAAVVAAGPIANFIYAILVLSVLYVVSGQNITPPVVARIITDSPAEKYGFQIGDRVLEANNRKVKKFEDIRDEIYINGGRTIDFQILRNDKEIQISAVLAERTYKDLSGADQKAGYLGILPGYAAVVAKVLPNSAAEAAGFQVGDEIIAVDDVEISEFQQVRDIVLNSNGRKLRFKVQRGSQALILPASPAPREQKNADGSITKLYLIGIIRATPPPVKLGPANAAMEAVRTSYVMIERTLDYLGQMIIGQRGTEELGGPIRIAQVSGQAAQLGIEQFIMLSVLLSLNLGFVNFLPIPMLDGGHLMFYLFEAVRGKPLTERMQEHALRFGFLVVLSLMVFVTWNDLVNLRVFENIAGWFS